MKFSWLFVILASAAAVAIFGGTRREPALKRTTSSILLPTGKYLPPLRARIVFHGRPTEMALSPSGDLVAVKHSHGLLFVDPKTRKQVQDLPMPSNDSYLAQLGGNGAGGLAWATDSEIWMTDAYRTLYSAVRKAGTFQWKTRIDLPGPDRGDSAPDGLVLSSEGTKAYISMSRSNAVAIVDLNTRRVVRQLAVGRAPGAILRDRNRLYVANLGGPAPISGAPVGPSSGSNVRVDKRGVANAGSVSVIDIPDWKVEKEISVGMHPCALQASADRSKVFVANANSDTISEIDTRNNRVDRTLKLSKSSFLGAQPTALSLAEDGSLYVCLSGEDKVVRLDLASGQVLNALDTDWYPDSILTIPGGAGKGEVVIANLKGIGSRIRDIDLSYHSYRKTGFNAYDYAGTITFTRHGLSDPAAPREETQAFAPRLRHVLYIIKENQTYDGVLGDLAEGDGDPRLCLFGEKITPNIHSLAREFTLFDNFYCNGVLSADGHQWTDEGEASEYIEKNMGGFSRSYPSDGTDALAYVSTGFIWDDALAHALSFRDYGEFVDVKMKLGEENASWSQAYRRYTAGLPLDFQQKAWVPPVERHLCGKYPGFNLAIPDVYRASVFLSDLRSCEKSGNLPNLMVMLLGNDHTSGTDPGFPSPSAAAADNDLALGRIVEGISHSRFWKDTAIFVVEDDAQDGLDHVDGHRTVALCISPYTRRHSVSKAFCNQDGLLRTLERVLGLPPMNRLDAAAPLMDCFQRSPNLSGFRSKPNTVPLDRLNPQPSALSGVARRDALLSKSMDFSGPDRANAKLLQQVIWRAEVKR